MSAKLKKFQPKLTANFLPKNDDGFIDYVETKRLIDIGLGVTGQLYNGLQSNSINIEEAILGAVLIDKSSFDLVENIFGKVRKPFYVDAHNTVYNSCRRLADKGVPIDLLTVLDDLVINQEDVAVGGAYFLTTLTNKVTSTANTEFHTLICFDHYTRRKFIEIQSQKLRAAFDKAVNIYELASEVVNEMQEIENPKTPGKTMSITEVMEIAKNAVDKKRLVGDFIRQGDVSVLFAPPKKGKSILAVQIADALSKGEGLFNNLLENECGVQKVLYFDFELRFSDWKKRYFGKDGTPYAFSKDNFFRFGDDDENPFNFKDLSENAEQILNKHIKKIKPDVIIIDNITMLANGNTADAEVAMKIINILVYQVKKFGVTAIVLAHMPKRNDPTKGIELKDLAGSMQLGNALSSANAIGYSNSNEKVQYLMQVDSRNEKTYGKENTLGFTLEHKNNMLQCVPLTIPFQPESEHLKFADASDLEAEQNEQIMEMFEKGMSYRTIAQKLFNSPTKSTTVYNRVKKMQQNAQTDNSDFEYNEEKNYAKNVTEAISDEEANKLDLPF